MSNLEVFLGLSMLIIAFGVIAFTISVVFVIRFLLKAIRAEIKPSTPPDS